MVKKSKKSPKSQKLKNHNFKRGILAVIGGLMISIAVGEFNFLSNVYPYISSYFHIYNKEITEDEMKYIHMIWTFSMAFGSPLAVSIYQFIGFHGTFIIAILLFGVSQIISSYITNFWIFLPIFSICGGLAQGACLIMPVYSAWRFFEPKNKSIVAGILISAYAASPIPLLFISLRIINPNEVQRPDDGYFPPEIAHNVPLFFKYFGIGGIILGLLGCSLILKPIKNDKGKPNKNKIVESNTVLTENTPYTFSNASNLLVNSLEDSNYLAASDSENEQVMRRRSSVMIPEEVVMIQTTIKPMTLQDFKIFKDPVFLNAYFINLFAYLMPHFFAFSFPTIGLKAGRTVQILKYAGIGGAIFNTLSRLYSGQLYQKIGYALTAFLFIFVQVVSAAFIVPASKNEYAYIACVSFFFNCFGGQLGLYPMVSDTLFKSKGAFSYSLLFSAFCLSNIVILNLKNYILDIVGGFGNLMIVLCVIAVIPIYNIIVLDRKIKEVSESNKKKTGD